jgi:hypothetical protein
MRKSTPNPSVFKWDLGLSDWPRPAREVAIAIWLLKGCSVWSCYRVSWRLDNAPNL